MPTLDPSEPEADRRAPPVVRRSALGCTKVRDSCHSCATSKIKCTREKPSCSKCEARGIKCEYFYARRPGRRRDDGSGHPTSCTSNSSSPSSLSSSSSSKPKSIPDKDTHSALPRSGDKIEVVGLSPQQGYATNGTAPPTSLPASNGFLNTPQSLLMTEAALTTDNILGQYPSDISSVLADSNMFLSLSDFNTDPKDMDFSMTDYFGHPAIDGDRDIGSLLTPETISFGWGALDSNDPLSAPFADSSWVPSLASSIPTSSTTDPNMMMMMMRAPPTPPTTDISCGCVAQALDLLKTLSSAQSSPTSSISGTSHPALSSSMTAMVSAQAVLVENKHHIDTVSNLLSCSSCTEDAFRLVIVSMIVLKILERYASVARIQGFGFGSEVGSVETDTGPRSANSMISSSEDQVRALSRTHTMPWDDSARGYAPARLVLGELHRVQRLVDRLSPKLTGSKEGDARGMEHAIWGGLQVANGNDKTQSTPFRSNTLAQMESDMRNSLSSLSADIITRLGQN
ncbi:hypothetical protein CNMCM6936_006507 [Aspergillus lentulus]|uniref:Zn(2)-C6 fungal-type domain-containing protein n=1 Tax=Aspergillus lentulus TaxID=293939 RepID=A0ABQ1A7G5_ASPLE|nr:hypothetical protein CNMCM6936_006507 [Aspergillus lentulus]GFF75304.1 hypothetical protein IFM60648_04413 [Aspergillus lentulus]GFF76858.1 hypothetical protein IFM47457_04257 [Aspergillus lentulus]